MYSVEILNSCVSLKVFIDHRSYYLLITYFTQDILGLSYLVSDYAFANMILDHPVLFILCVKYCKLSEYSFVHPNTFCMKNRFHVVCFHNKGRKSNISQVRIKTNRINIDKYRIFLFLFTQTFQ